MSKDDPPFLFMHGDEGRIVPLRHSELLDKALKDAGVESELVVVKGKGHGFGGPEIMDKVTTFFEKHLPAEKAP